jgi:hypothetical protein
MFSLIGRTYDPSAIAIQESLFKFYKFCLVAGPTLIIAGQIIFIVAIVRAKKIKTAGNTGP